MDCALERGITLVTSLHQVDMALAHFPRIVGLREGRVLFDLPSAEVTQALLQRLYERHEDGLRGGSSGVDIETGAALKPSPMYCR
jgi:phosphonate transport system ATP-binding protein